MTFAIENRVEILNGFRYVKNDLTVQFSSDILNSIPLSAISGPFIRWSRQDAIDLIPTLLSIDFTETKENTSIDTLCGQIYIDVCLQLYFSHKQNLKDLKFQNIKVKEELLLGTTKLTQAKTEVTDLFTTLKQISLHRKPSFKTSNIVVLETCVKEIQTEVGTRPDQNSSSLSHELLNKITGCDNMGQKSVFNEKTLICAINEQLDRRSSHHNLPLLQNTTQTTFSYKIVFYRLLLEFFKNVRLRTNLRRISFQCLQRCRSFNKEIYGSFPVTVDVDGVCKLASKFYIHLSATSFDTTVKFSQKLSIQVDRLMTVEKLLTKVRLELTSSAALQEKTFQIHLVYMDNNIKKRISREFTLEYLFDNKNYHLTIEIYNIAHKIGSLELLKRKIGRNDKATRPVVTQVIPINEEVEEHVISSEFTEITIPSLTEVLSSDSTTVSNIILNDDNLNLSDLLGQFSSEEI